jgi:hypothetical protein
MLAVFKQQEHLPIPSATRKEVVLNTNSLLVIQQRQKKWLKLRLSEKQITTFLFVAQGLGGIFVGIFLAAYLAGLPSTAVFHGEPAFRIPLFIFGAVLLVMVLSAFVLTALSKKD